MRGITRTVWVLSLISLFTDAASEMVYPIMPVYLRSIGFSVLLIGVLEGIAEFTTGISKGYFGKLSDELGRRAPFVQLGYTISALAKPLLAVSVKPLWVFLMRSADRLGKGIRTGARDALLSDEATPQSKGKVFGFHRSMDTLGAVLGPLLALIYLHYHPENYRGLFLLAFVPGILAVALSLLLRDRHHRLSPSKNNVSFFSAFRYWRESSTPYRTVVKGLLLFALFNSSDVFLLLKVKESGADDRVVITIYIFYNLVYALSAFPLGNLADTIGLKRMYIFGVVLFASVYLGMSFTDNLHIYYILFFVYGLYAAATEGVARAWITNLADKKDTATAIGAYTAFQSVCTLLASSLAGWIWFAFGPTTTFFITAIIALIVAVYFLLSRY
ncbi:MAG: MFS transporter [Cyclobacteriaceae bacterium]|nr:MFS transporter [Cyclobacteriaceae bacterium]MCX7636469.1 MFS transporter [Cyclobacteriaceae bacterium]MDW8330788.1 MFS transporter [Cyclobacteriaceae bacterium]